MPESSLLDQKTSQVEYEIKIDGTKIPDEYQVAYISVNKSLNKIATARIEIDNGDSYNAEFSIIEEQTYESGKEVEISMGYQTQTKLVYKGIIVKHGVKITSNQTSKIVLECADKAIKLTGQREFKIFEEMKDSDIMQQIANDKGVTVNCSSTSVTHQRVVQQNTSGWDFIITRAQANYLVVFTDNGQLKIKEPSEGAQENLKVVYGENINSMDVSIDARHQLVEVETSAWSYKNQELQKATSKPPNEVDKLGTIKGDKIARDLGFTKTKLHSSGDMEGTELSKWADSTLLMSRLSRVKGTIKTQGYAEINPNDFLEIKSVGKYFDGKAYVSGVYHEQKEGNWLTEIELGIKPELFVANKTDVTLPISDGLFPGYPGLFIGKVLQIDNDPDGESRVLIKIPLLGGDVTNGVWARVSNIMASNNFGSVFFPEVDDEVICGAIGGDLRFPVILGHLYSSGRNFDDYYFVHNENNHHKGWKTRSDLLFHFDDEKRIIKIETPAGNLINLDEDQQQIWIKDQHGNEIKMDQDGISISSVKDFKVQANQNIEQNSGRNSTYKANGSFEASSQSGSTLKSSAITEVKGSLVKLN